MLGVLADEWTLLIVQQSLLGATRYAEFAARLPISHSVLSRRLSAMTTDDLLERVRYQDNPPRFEYTATERAQSLWPVLTSIWHWERSWVPDHPEPLPVIRHAVCGAACSPALTCRNCRRRVSTGDLTAHWGPSGSWPRSIPEVATRRRSHRDRAGGASDLFPHTMSILGNRWAFAIMVAAFVGTTRFSGFAEQLGAPPASLVDRLQLLVSNGVLDGEYRLTPKGDAVLPIIVTALDWAQRWFVADEGPAVIVTHMGCGSGFVATLTCDRCNAPLRGNQITRG
ncbi:MAG: helix-turn-helix domain-containing protein [Mycolicibacterium neoaurum]|uniref:winged helix-turn-helix transcriptional regulator n=1 Tax=Mycolicibacterium neoaurum TaxID=1795 RepID=UPI002FFB8817